MSVPLYAHSSMNDVCLIGRVLCKARAALLLIGSSSAHQRLPVGGLEVTSGSPIPNPASAAADCLHKPGEFCFFHKETKKKKQRLHTTRIHLDPLCCRDCCSQHHGQCYLLPDTPTPQFNLLISIPTKLSL